MHTIYKANILVQIVKNYNLNFNGNYNINSEEYQKNNPRNIYNKLTKKERSELALQYKRENQ